MTIWPMYHPDGSWGCFPIKEGHVIVENYLEYRWEDFDNNAEYVEYYSEKMKRDGCSYQSIAGFRRRMLGKKKVKP